MDYPGKAELAIVYSTFLEAFVNATPGLEAKWQQVKEGKW